MAEIEEPDYEWHTQAFTPIDPEELNIAQRFFDLGLIWLVNRTLHPFGYAIGVTVNNSTDLKVTGFNLHHSTDAQGITFGEDLEMAGRQRFYKALKKFAGDLGW